jgi:hypothetical protein
MHDILRPIFWNNSKIFWWYKQNMVLFAPRGHDFFPNNKYNILKNVVHYELYEQKARQLNKLLNGNSKIIDYIKLLIKSIIGSENIRKIKNMTKNFL